MNRIEIPLFMILILTICFVGYRLDIGLNNILEELKEMSALLRKE